MRITVRVIDDKGRAFVGDSSLVSEKTSVSKPRRPRQGRESSPGARLSLPDRIISLRDSGFFAKPQVPREVFEKLRPSYHCELDRVQMALFRLGRRKDLRKASKIVNGKRVPAYVW